MKYHLIIACLCSLPVGSAMLMSQPIIDAVRHQSEQQLSQQSEDIRALVPGTPVEREISGANRHIYQVSLTAGQFFEASLQQKGNDAIVLLHGSDGKIIKEFVEPVYDWSSPYYWAGFVLQGEWK